MNAIHGGKAKHDQIDAHTIAALLRGGRLPQASVSPAAMRATRDRLRRRTHLMRTRAELWAHVHTTTSQDNRPDIGKKSADQANREGVADRFPERAVQTTSAVDLALLTYDDERLSDLERSILNTAKPPEAHPLYLLQTVPGMGKILSRVLRYGIHDIDRCPRGQDFVSSGRVVTCAQASAGTRLGPSGKNIGNAHLKWACSEAAALVRRHNDPGPN
jgi:transposase